MLSRARRRAIALSALVAGLLVNYWPLESLLADRADPVASWVSELGARSESTAWIFDALDVASALALVAFGLALRGAFPPSSREIRRGAGALVAVGVLGVVDGLFPLSCADALTSSCELRYDLIDVVHATETVLAAVVSVAAFGLLAQGFRREAPGQWPGVLAVPTVVAGVAWLVLNLLMGVAAIAPAFDEVRGVLHRLALVGLGSWLILVGAMTEARGRGGWRT